MHLASKIPQSATTLALPVAGALVLALGVGAAPAHAQQARTFVSGFGSDTNAPNCFRTAPCRSFQVAHDNTLANGEITVLDPGSYGAVTINRSISIINDGVGEAGMLISGGVAGATINAAATDKVSLRGLTIKGIGFGGGTGIVFNTGAFLSVENCAIRNLTGTNGLGNGIIFRPALSGGSSNLAVTNTLVADNDASGIWIKPTGSSGTVAVSINRVEVYHNGIDGIVAEDSQFSGGLNGAMWVNVESSIAAQNGNGVGFAAVAPAQQGPIYMNVVRSVSANNGTGFAAGASAVMYVGQSSLIGNGTTWSGFTVNSFGDNYVAQNQDGSPNPPGLVNRK